MSRFSNIIIGIIIPCVLIPTEIWLFHLPWDQLAHPKIEASVAQISQQSEILIVGNSVAINLNSQELSQESQKTVRNASMTGSLPAHWTALLAQARLRYSIQPKVVLVYVVENNLFRTRLIDEADISMLRQLSPQYVDGLSEKAIGETLNHIAFQNRVALRDRVLKLASRVPVQIFWPMAYGQLENSLEEVFGRTISPNSPQKRATPGQPRQRTEAKGATIEPLEQSIFPFFQREVQRLGAELFVVLPARSQPFRCQDLEYTKDVLTLVDQGVHILDLRALFIEKHHFSSLHHPRPQAAYVISKSIAKGLKNKKKDIWVAGCTEK